MITQIEHQSPKTKAYTRHIFADIAGKSPFHKGKLLEIDIKEGVVPFPEFTEIPRVPSKTGKISDTVPTSSMIRTYTFSKAHKTNRDQIQDKKARQMAKANSLFAFTSNILEGIGNMEIGNIKGLSPIEVYLSYIVDNPEAIYQKIKEVEPSLLQQFEVQEDSQTAHAEFSESPSQIKWLGEVIPIPPNTYQYCACIITFQKQPGEIVHWDEIGEYIDGLPKANVKSSWQRVYNTMLAINERVEKKVGKRLFETTRKSCRRVA